MSLFHKILQLDKFEGADFKYDDYMFKSEHQNTQICHFWSQIKGFLFFAPNFPIKVKLEGTDFKYDNNMFKFEPQNTQICHFWSRIKGFLFFAPNFAIRKIGVR